MENKNERLKLKAFLDKVPKKYRTGNYLLACYASLPATFTPDMLYQLWLNFQTYFDLNTQTYRQIHLVAISDLLQSGLCKKIGFELFEMEPGIAKYLQTLTPAEISQKREIRISPNTPQDIAQFVLEYAKRYYVSSTHRHLYYMYSFNFIWKVDPQEAKVLFNKLIDNAVLHPSDTRRQLKILIDNIAIAQQASNQDTTQEKEPLEEKKLPQLSYTPQPGSIELTDILKADELLWQKVQEILSQAPIAPPLVTPEPITALNALLDLDFEYQPFEDISLAEHKQAYSVNAQGEVIALALRDTQLVDFDFLKNFPHLQKLYLGGNQIKDLSPITHLSKLTRLGIRYNQITELSLDFLEHLPHLQALFLTGNPITNIPQEIFDKLTNNLEAIKDHLISVQNEEDCIEVHEAKLIFVGAEAVGKSSLIRAVSQPKYTFDSENLSIPKIDRVQWRPQHITKHGQSIDFTINISNFSEQEINDSTHPFFLSKQAVYVFVWERKKGENLPELDHRLNTLSLLSHQAPIIVVQNKVDVLESEVNQKKWQKYFPNIVAFLKTSCKTGRGMEPLRETILKQILQLPHIGKIWNKSRMAIREKLASHPAHYLPYADYLQICAAHGITELEAHFLSRQLHDTKAIMHYDNDPLLKETMVLSPRWVSDAFYQLLNSQAVDENNRPIVKNGTFSQLDLPYLWNDIRFRYQRSFLLQLMEHLEQVFKLANTDKYIIPKGLPVEPPTEWDNFIPDFSPAIIRVRREYHYEFMPEGLFSRFMCLLQSYIVDNLFWKYGVALTHEDSQAVVLWDDRSSIKIIKMEVWGAQASQLLARTRDILNSVHLTLGNPPFTEKVPCICTECIQDDQPYLYNYQTLLKFQEKRRMTIACERSFEDVSVVELLESITSPQKRLTLLIKNYQLFEFFQRLNPRGLTDESFFWSFLREFIVMGANDFFIQQLELWVETTLEAAEIRLNDFESPADQELTQWFALLDQEKFVDFFEAMSSRNLTDFAFAGLRHQFIYGGLDNLLVDRLKTWLLYPHLEEMFAIPELNKRPQVVRSLMPLLEQDKFADFFEALTKRGINDHRLGRLREQYVWGDTNTLFKQQLKVWWLYFSDVNQTTKPQETLDLLEFIDYNAFDAFFQQLIQQGIRDHDLAYLRRNFILDVSDVDFAERLKVWTIFENSSAINRYPSLPGILEQKSVKHLMNLVETLQIKQFFEAVEALQIQDPAIAQFRQRYAESNKGGFQFTRQLTAWVLDHFSFENLLENTLPGSKERLLGLIREKRMDNFFQELEALDVPSYVLDNLSNQNDYSYAKKLERWVTNYFNNRQETIGKVPSNVTKIIQEVKEKKLESIDLGYLGLMEIPEEVYRLSHLKTLILGSHRSKNQGEMNQIISIAEKITHLQKLEKIYLSDNLIQSLPEGITQLKNLKTLGLSRNEIEEIPKIIFEITSLETLYLSGNPIKEIPTQILDLKNLQTLGLNSVKIPGFPDEIEDLENCWQMVKDHLKNTSTQALKHAFKNSRTLILSKGVYQVIPMNELLYIEAQNNGCLVFTNQNIIETNQKLHTIIEKFQSDQVIQTHRSYAINLQKITSYDSNFTYVTLDSTDIKSKLKVKFAKTVWIGASYRENLKNALSGGFTNSSSSVQESKLNDLQKSTTINFTERGIIHPITLSDILYVQANNKYSFIVTDTNEIDVLGSLKSIEEKLLPYGIVKVNRSFLVNLDKIIRFDKPTTYVDIEHWERKHILYHTFQVTISNRSNVRDYFDI